MTASKGIESANISKTSSRRSQGRAAWRTILNFPHTCLDVVQGQISDALLESVQVHLDEQESRRWVNCCLVLFGRGQVGVEGIAGMRI